MLRVCFAERTPSFVKVTPPYYSNVYHGLACGFSLIPNLQVHRQNEPCIVSACDIIYIRKQVDERLKVTSSIMAPPRPRFEDLPLRKGDPPYSAWGIWGPNDELGTLVSWLTQDC